LRQRRINI
jgi:hypothetical protein